MIDIRKTKKSPNYSKGRVNWKPDIIVCHISEGYYESGCDWLCNPTSQASTHFFVSKNGDVSQLVDIQDIAWGNGTTVTEGDSRCYKNSSLLAVRERKCSANNYTISIEHEGFYKEAKGNLDEKQLSATVELIKYIRSEVKDIYNITIPIDREHIVGHCDITPTWKPNCPGQNFPFDEIIKRLIEDNLVSTYIPEYRISDSNLSAMVDLGVINSPDYWKNVNLQYLNDLLANVSKTRVLDKRINNGITDFDIAMEVITYAGIINSPDYWLSTVKNNKVQYLKELLINIANKCRNILERIVWAEARGEDEKGQILIANVVFNRCKNKQFPNGIHNVVFQKDQFSPIKNMEYYKAVPSEKIKNSCEKALCVDYSQGALYFCTPIAASKTDGWLYNAIKEGKIKYLFSHGDHNFYK